MRCSPAPRACRGAAAPNGTRQPQALAELFRDDSRAELGALDVDEHELAELERLALAGGLDPPAVAMPPRLVEIAMAAAAAAAGDGGGPAGQQAQAQQAEPLQAPAAKQPRPPPQQQRQQQPGEPGKCAVM